MTTRASGIVVAGLVALTGCPSSNNAPAGGSAGQANQTQLSIPVASVPETSRWELDPENSSAEFVAKHILSKVRGMFPQPAGTVALDEATPANSQISASIKVGGLTTGVEERDTHLKSAEFFDAARYPTITFVSTSVSRVSSTSYSVTGNLTMHGVTKVVTLAVTASPPFHHAGGVRRGIEATTVVNRKDFGLAWEFPGEGPGIVVGDTIQVTINAELVLHPDAR